jgi:outer membrane receptor protein involved in Fe transport
LGFAVTDSLEITPSVSYQKLEINDAFDLFWVSLSSGDNYARPAFFAGDPATDPALSPFNYPNEESGEDEFYLPALAINWDLGDFELFSNTSYFTRDYIQHSEFTFFYSWFYNFADPITGFWPGSGQKAMAEHTQEQKNFVQEIRIQSTDDSSRLKWVAGLFYSHAKQTANMDIVVNFFANASPLGTFFWPFPGVDDGPPFGPGSTAFENYFGVPPEPDSSLWANDFTTKDTQLAGFAQIDYDITEVLTLTLGLRVARTELDFYNQYRSPENNLNAPMGMELALPIDPLYWSAVEQNEETANTPKIGLSYDIDDDNMIYVTIAKRFRPAGATQSLPLTLCGDNLIRLGYVDENGNPAQPTSYDSDSVWSYEIGTKNRLFGDRLSIDASAYIIDWKDIQSKVYVWDCNQGFETNLGEARSKGFDLGFQIYPINSLMITGTIGHNRTEFTKDAFSPGGELVISNGSLVPGAPTPWMYSLSAHHDFSLMNQQFYWHADFTHSSEERPQGVRDPESSEYNPDLEPIPAYSRVNARIGTLWGHLDVSLFAKNLTNEQPHLDLRNNHHYTGFRRFIWSDETLRPRTVGIFISYRY